MAPHEPFEIHIHPRASWTWGEFLAKTPPGSIALDGMVRGGPRFDPRTGHVNFDHHDGVEREATMSTAMQAFNAIKLGLMEGWHGKCRRIVINDTDQDTALAVWLLRQHRLFEGTGTIPAISRLLGLNDKLDITAGSFPLNVDERLQRQHLWVFQPYTDLRKSGGLIGASEAALRDNLDATLVRLSKFQMGEAGEVDPDERHEILYDGHDFKVINEIGGTDARRLLFNRGLKAYLSIIGSREIEGRRISSYTVGRRSRYITAMPIGPDLYRRLNDAEGAPSDAPAWGGSDIVGGCRQSHLPWEQVRDVIRAAIGHASPLAA